MLRDSFNREIHYLRLSVTDRCDFRCFYCLPREFRGFEMPEEWLTSDEIERVIGQFAALGVRHVRLTGGCLLYTSPSPRDSLSSRMPSSA